MAKRSGNMRSEFEEEQLATLAKKMQYRDWTDALVRQRMAELDGKLAAGDMPVLDEVVTGSDLPPSYLNESGSVGESRVDATASADEDEDVFSAFMEG